MNNARFAASAIAAAAVTITVGGAASGLWLYHHEPATPGRVEALPGRQAPALPRASSAPHPHPAIRDPAPLHYVGAFERGAPWTYQPLTRFASVAGRKPNITIYYSRWGDPFRARFATAAAQAGAVVLVHLEPRRESMVAIASGGWDRYLHRYAAQVRHYGGQVILSFAPEANGKWYPWGWHHTHPHDWVTAWRHVVRLFRSSGATNVTWLWDVSAQNRATGPLHDWWPGPAYVDWVGVDGYYFTPADTFRSVIGRTVDQIREFAKKPILLSEIGIGPLAGKARKIPGLFAGIRHRHLLGLIWFDVTQNRGPYHQDWRLESGPAVAAFRAGVRSLHLARPRQR